MNVFLCVVWKLETAEKLIGRTDLCYHNQAHWSVWSCNQSPDCGENSWTLDYVCCGFRMWNSQSSLDFTLPHTVNALHLVCSFPADRSITCSYTFDWWEPQCCGSHGKKPCLFCSFSRFWFIPGSEMLFTSALQLGTYISALHLASQELCSSFSREPENVCLDVDPDFTSLYS